jgi:hypothetical protein
MTIQAIDIPIEVQPTIQQAALDAGLPYQEFIAWLVYDWAVTHESRQRRLAAFIALVQAKKAKPTWYTSAPGVITGIGVISPGVLNGD